MLRGARSSRLPPDDASPRGLRENLSPGLGRRSFLFDDAPKKRPRQEPAPSSGVRNQSLHGPSQSVRSHAAPDETFASSLAVTPAGARTTFARMRAPSRRHRHSRVTTGPRVYKPSRAGRRANPGLAVDEVRPLPCSCSSVRRVLTAEGRRCASWATPSERAGITPLSASKRSNAWLHWLGLRCT